MASNTLDDIRRHAKTSAAKWALGSAGALILTAAAIVFRANVAMRPDVIDLRAADMEMQNTLRDHQLRADEQAKEIIALRAQLGDVALMLVDQRARLGSMTMRESDRERAEVAARNARTSFLNTRDRHGISAAIDRAMKE